MSTVFLPVRSSGGSSDGWSGQRGRGNNSNLFFTIYAGNDANSAYVIAVEKRMYDNNKDNFFGRKCKHRNTINGQR